MAVRKDLLQQYLATTSAKNAPIDESCYKRRVAPLAWRLRGWLPTRDNARCIDLGSGFGEIPYLLRTLGVRNVTAVDLCGDQLRYLKSITNTELIEGDALAYLQSCESESADLITALNFLEHLPDEMLRGVLYESQRVLRPGGLLIGLIPNGLSPFSGSTRYWDFTHYRAFTPSSLRQLAVLTGFSVPVFRECGPIPHGIISGMRYLLWQVIRLGIAAWLLVEVADVRNRVYTMDMLVRMQRPG